jgi:hypothetical protein
MKNAQLVRSNIGKLRRILLAMAGVFLAFSLMFPGFGALRVPVASAQTSITASSATTGVLNNASSTTFSYTTPNTSNRLLMVGVSAQQPGASINSITYNGVALTRLGRFVNSSQSRIEIWYLKSPTIGTYNLVVNNSQPDNGIIGAMTFSGVNLTTTFGTLATAQSNGTTASVTAASAAGELVYSVVAFNNGSTNLNPGSGQTEYWDATINSSTTGAGSTKAGAASVAMSWSSTSAPWTIGAVSIKPAAAQECPGNLLQNPGFENNLNSWSSWGTVGTSSDSRSGGKAANITGGNSGITQAIPPVVGQAYTVEAWAKAQSTIWADL